MNKYIPVIGLEVHVELKTKSKMFCSCSADYFGQQPNTLTCPVCLGLPGALPVPNKTAIDWCVMLALSLNCKINELSKFDRKNYFYPDLPKGYQISQYDLPFGKEGDIKLNNGKTIRIRRVHMEEDTAKLIHQFGTQNDKGITLIDFNRSGVPLVEIVTEPDFNDAYEVTEYLQKLQQIVRYLNVADAHMEQGEMRLEPNISLQKITATNKQILPISNKELPKYKVEVKNINSFKFVKKAIDFEIKRQTDILESGEIPSQETRGWHEAKQKTFSQRVKEEANDYRYFPEPDIPPIKISNQQIANLTANMVELPDAKLKRFKTDYNLSDYDAEIVTRDKKIADYFEEAVAIGKNHNISPKQIANTLINKKPDLENIMPAALLKQILAQSQITMIDKNELMSHIKQVISENTDAIEDYKKGKMNAMQFLIGKVLQSIKKKVDPQLVKDSLEKLLKEV